MIIIGKGNVSFVIPQLIIALNSAVSEGGRVLVSVSYWLRNVKILTIRLLTWSGLPVVTHLMRVGTSFFMGVKHDDGDGKQ